MHLEGERMPMVKKVHEMMMVVLHLVGEHQGMMGSVYREPLESMQLDVSPAVNVQKLATNFFVVRAPTKCFQQPFHLITIFIIIIV